MNSKRAQSEIITTVLIILLVLAAIIIVWQVVQGTVGNAGKKAGTASDCLNTGLTITSAKNTTPTNVSVTLEKGSASGLISPTDITLIVYNGDGTVLCTGKADGSANIPTTAFGQGHVSYNNAACVLVSGTTYTVKFAPLFGTQQCDPMGSVSFTV